MIFWAVALLMLVSCNQSGNKPGTEAAAGAGEGFLTSTVEEIVAQPAEYEGKEVAVSGMVTHVCRHSGQKCFVLGKDGQTQLRIVTGGDIDEFLIDMEGSTIAFRGVVRILDTQQSAEMAQENASMAEHSEEMAHSAAEQSETYIDAIDFTEVTL
ncbi:MAG: hypothetical protein ACWGNV_07310 [Bacteroidales bacterium]